MSLCLDDSGKWLCSCLPFQRSFLVVVWGREVIEMIWLCENGRGGILGSTQCYLAHFVWLPWNDQAELISPWWLLWYDWFHLTFCRDMKKLHTAMNSHHYLPLISIFSYLEGTCLKLGLFWPAYPFSTSISSNRFGYTTESLACALKLREPGAVELPLSSPSAATPRGAELVRHDFS